MESRRVVLSGVRVTQELSEAMQQTAARGRLMLGKICFRSKPRTAPIKKRGMMNPPRHPVVTVMAMAPNFAIRRAIRNPIVKFP